MDEIVLAKIVALQARVVKESGMTLKRKGRELVTGAISGCLDETAGSAANLALLNLTSGLIHLRWSIVATLPILADALAAGELAEAESGPLRVTFEEVGQIAKDGSGFEARGTGQIAPGSLLSKARVLAHNQFVRIVDRKTSSMSKTLGRGQPVRCAFLPESNVEAALPKPLGGGNHRLHLVGGFTLVPVLTLGRLE